MTGITSGQMASDEAKESIFSDLNNMKVVTTTSDDYGSCFGFTEEVFAAMDEYDLKEKENVKSWYDGFIFGKWKDIYNPWSILNFLDTGKLATYWANTSSNGLISKLIREGSPDVKTKMEDLLHGKVFRTVIDEQIVFSQLNRRDSAVWSLLLAREKICGDAYRERNSGGTNQAIWVCFRGERSADWVVNWLPLRGNWILPIFFMCRFMLTERHLFYKVYISY